MTRPVSVALVAILTVSCAPTLMKLPAGPGQPASDTRDAVTDATVECRAVRTYSAEISVNGSVAGQRLRGRLIAGLAAPSSARLEAVAPFGQPIFILVARGDDATLLLPRDKRVLEHAQPAAVLEAVAGVPLDAMDLRETLTACAQAPDLESGRRIGDNWRVVSDGPTEVYLHRETVAASWRIASTIHHAPRGSGQSPGEDWRTEYRDFQNGLPHTVRLVSNDVRRFDLRLSLSQVDVNAPLGVDVFRVQIPPSAQPITLEELRHARPGLRED